MKDVIVLNNLISPDNLVFLIDRIHSLLKIFFKYAKIGTQYIPESFRNLQIAWRRQWSGQMISWSCWGRSTSSTLVGLLMFLPILAILDPVLMSGWFMAIVIKSIASASCVNMMWTPWIGLTVWSHNCWCNIDSPPLLGIHSWNQFCPIHLKSWWCPFSISILMKLSCQRHDVGISWIYLVPLSMVVNVVIHLLCALEELCCHYVLMVVMSSINIGLGRLEMNFEFQVSARKKWTNAMTPVDVGYIFTTVSSNYLVVLLGALDHLHNIVLKCLQCSLLIFL